MTRNRLVLSSLCGLAGVYLSAYLINSLSGGYRLIIVSSINHPIDYSARNKANGGALAWQPRYGNYTRTSADTLGKLFYPPIFADETFWHRDIAATDIASREWLKHKVSSNQIHPDDREMYDDKPLY